MPLKNCADGLQHDAGSGGLTDVVAGFGGIVQSVGSDPRSGGDADIDGAYGIRFGPTRGTRVARGSDAQVGIHSLSGSHSHFGDGFS